MTTFEMMVMWEAWGIEFKDDMFYLKNTSTVANGHFQSYFPKFMGFGKSNKISTSGKIVDGDIVSWKKYNKYGDVMESWEQ